MNTSDFYTLSENKPANCELRPDYMYYSSACSTKEKWCILLSIPVLVLMVCITTYTEQDIYTIGYTFITYTLICLCILSKKEIVWLDEKGFHHEIRSLGLKISETNISRSSIRGFQVKYVPSISLVFGLVKSNSSILFTEIVTDGKPERIFALNNPSLTLPSSFTMGDSEITCLNLFSGILQSQDLNAIYKKDEYSPVLFAWIVEAGNIVLQNLTCAELERAEQQDTNSDNSQLEVETITELRDDNYIPIDTIKDNIAKIDKFTFSTRDKITLPPAKETIKPDKIQLHEKPSYSVWNMEQTLDYCRFYRRNKFILEKTLDWKVWFYTLLVAFLICIPFFFFGNDFESYFISQTLLCIFTSTIISILLFPVSLLFLFIFTRFTTVTWTFSSQKATLKRTLFGIPFLYLTFDMIDITHFIIQQRFLMGKTDYFCDLIFLNKDDKVAFRIKKIERDDAKWILSSIKDYFK